MENVDTKKKIIGLPSTIVAGIFIAIALFFAISLIWLNLKEAIESYMQSAQESASENEENVGEMIIVTALVAGIGVLAILIFHYGMVLIPLMITSFCLIPVIKNLKRADNKTIRIINFVYLGLIASIHCFLIVKFVLFAAGVA